MAWAFFERSADPSKAVARSAGTHPADRVHPEVVAAMAEIGIDLSEARPQRLTAELAEGAAMLVTMGCGDECPYVPGAQLDDWPLPDPKGKGVDAVREIRDEVARRVDELVRSNGWGRA